MNNKKIVVNIDLKNKRVRKGFVSSNINKKKNNEPQKTEEKISDKIEIKEEKLEQNVEKNIVENLEKDSKKDLDRVLSNDENQNFENNRQHNVKCKEKNKERTRNNKKLTIKPKINFKINFNFDFIFDLKEKFNCKFDKINNNFKENVFKSSKEKIEKCQNQTQFQDQSKELEDVKIEYVKKSELEKISKGISIVNKHKKKDKKEREKRIGKTLKEVIREKKEAYDKRETINFGPAILSILAIFVVILLYILFEYGPILGISLNIKDVISETKIDIVSGEGDFYATYNDELLVYSNQVIATYNENGKKTWNYTLEQMFTPKIYIKGAYMVVANNSSGNIYLFENKKEILNMKLDGQISNIYIDNNGYLAIEYASKGYKKIIGIYDRNGKNIYNAYLENSTIADIKLLDNARKFIVTKINSTSFKSGIEVILVDSTKTEDNIKQIIKLDNNFLYDLTIQGQNIVMLLDNELIKINIDTGEKITIKSFESSQMLYFTLNGNYYTCVEKELNNEIDEYIIRNVRFDGSSISTLKIANSPKLVVTSGLLNYFVYKDSYRVVNKWGIEVANKKLSTIPKDIIVFNNEKSVAFIYTNIVYIENL